MDSHVNTDGAISEPSTLTQTLEPHVNSPMHTALKQFCEEFVHVTQPLIDPLQQATTTLENIKNPDAPIKNLLPDMREIQHQFQGLIDKVQQQQAYVLIFGPLKSGKSTFMNATCASYVSEVTSLPAYPCLVHVSHADTSSYVIYQYDGQTITYDNQDDLHQAVEVAHQDLTAALRQSDENGLSFDPATHMPNAIRKIEVKLPLEQLEQSGAVLVDTPGLYSRMKFGYDLMTREFRDAAACAIFIVKTDNLFLEQVFEEFHELLELFSRIFLVVNLDSTKKDLQPDGTLQPSLEHKNPEKIIEAFKNLAMSAPLKKAADQGRLQICPVDLLGAASHCIANTGSTLDTPLKDTDDFKALRTDLTDYLNSSEYLRSFMIDSLRRAQNLLSETQDITQNPSVIDLTQELEELQQATDKAQAQAQAITRLQQINWNRHAQTLRDSLFACMWTLAEEVRTTTGLALTGAIDTWFDAESSLSDLNHNHITSLLNKARNQFVDLLQKELQNQLQGVAGGLAVSAETLRDVVLAELDLDSATQQAAKDINPARNIDPQISNLSSHEIPVKKGFWDIILFRSKQKVQDRFFGELGSPSQKITPAQKTKKLGQEGQQAMQKIVAQQLEVLLNQASQTMPEQIFQDYIQALSNSLKQTLHDKALNTQGKLIELQDKLEQTQNVVNAITTLGIAIEDATDAVNQIDREFAPTSDQEVIEPEIDEHLEEEILEPKEEIEEAADLLNTNTPNDSDDNDTIKILEIKD